MVKDTVEEVKETRRNDPSKVKSNDLMAILTWVKVNKNVPPRQSSNYFNDSQPRSLELVDVDKGTPLKCIGEDLIGNIFSADFFFETKQVTKTEMAQTLTQSYNVPFTVVFETDETKEKNTEPRTLRGRLIKADPLFGKSMVEDLDRPKGDRVRWIKHDNLKSLIVQGTKFVLKGAK